ncbi:DNA-(apurinic or apyrimidinic site) lyase [Brevibacterium sanguinis]|uniref:Formamidopyrimidine-DNA glycosylase n=2 Tax=Brevibacterium TaxID=1696 RepID=A0A366INK3_9MICO|nr:MULTISPECIES: bifunctional DNA-formamidopyrimidine glycosylase/DNA-(apurinic or apyrimidinic site) lyase [Brevibacterium]RBP67935.1 DNA-(apurinic or apyrimidinic site) lyase [Brevibacterium sanguinis]RBP74648.1 DNA-(apurinic or apyrimidinic site) lyase [Brevibacterium celere]
MPELPEVESVRRGVHEWTAGATITRAEVLDPRILGTTSQRRVSPDAVADFVDAVTGRSIRAAERRGKFMWLTLGEDRLSLIVHLGMSGQLRVHAAADPRHRHTRAVFALERAGETYEMRFVDQRIFGHLGVAPLTWSQGRLVPASASHIAADPLEEAFDAEAAVSLLSTKRTALKAALLDQGLVSGIGNIYADEALFRARVHPLAIPARTRRSRLVAVLESAASVMSDALLVGGTSFDSLYVNVNGESGYFDRALLAYGREGQECVRCGTPIRRLVIGGRSSHFCPKCQKAPTAPKPLRPVPGR